MARNYTKTIALIIGGCVQLGLLMINLVITSKMQIDDRGVYALVVAVVMTVSGVCNFGFSNALIKRMHTQQLALKYTFNIVYLIFVQIVVAIGLILLVLSSFTVITIATIEQLGLTVIFIVISLLLRAYGQALLLGLDKINLFQISKVIPVVLFVLILVLQDKYLLVDVLFAWMLSEVSIVIFYIFFTLMFFRINTRDTDMHFIKDLKFGLRSLFGHTAFIEGYKFDQIVLGYIIPVADLAIYAVSKSVASVLRFIPQSLSQVAYPVILKANDIDKMLFVKRFVLASFFSGAVFLIVGYFIFDGFVIDYLGDAYAESGNVVLVMFLGVLAYAPRRIIYEYFKAINAPGVTSKIELLIIVGYIGLLLISNILGYTNILTLASIVLLINLVALILTLKLFSLKRLELANNASYPRK